MCQAHFRFFAYIKTDLFNKLIIYFIPILQIEKWRFLEDWVTYSDHMLVSGKAETGSHVCLGHIGLTRARNGPPDHTVHFLWAVLGHHSIPVSCSTARNHRGLSHSCASRLGLKEFTQPPPLTSASCLASQLTGEGLSGMTGLPTSWEVCLVGLCAVETLH